MLKIIITLVEVKVTHKLRKLLAVTLILILLMWPNPQKNVRCIPLKPKNQITSIKEEQFKRKKHSLKDFKAGSP